MRTPTPSRLWQRFTTFGLLILTAFVVFYYRPAIEPGRFKSKRLFQRKPISEDPKEVRILQETTSIPGETIRFPTNSTSTAKVIGYKKRSAILTSTEKEQEVEPHEAPEALVVYIVALILSVGGLCREVKKATGIPYTPQLLLLGILLGTFADDLGTIGKSFKVLLGIDPHGILMVFIPSIIFESAYNSDPFVTKKQIWQILMLAVPGVIVGAVLMTIGFNFVLGYSNELSFAGGLTFGAIVGATDPVAVVALLKELGTPIKFNMLLEGESLLNDGTAMVFYLVFSAIYKAQGVTVGGIIWQFIQLSGGGILLGIVTFTIAFFWIKRIVKDDLLTISVTFMSCYLSFFIGETYLKVSGIIAIVTLGTLMSMYGKVKIHPETHHSVHAVWSFIQYGLETVIFVLTGGYIGFYTLCAHTSTITRWDWGRMLLFYFVMTVARYLMILFFSPFMNKTGYPVTHKDILVLTWGGLRGAIALSLGLIVYGDTGYTARFRDLVLFYLAGMITLTVLFNGLTMKWVMQKINFLPKNGLREKFKQNLQKQLVLTSFKVQQEMKDHRYLQMATWETVFESSGVDGIISAQAALKDKQISTKSAPLLVHSNTVDQTTLEIRYRIYRLIKAQVWKKFEEDFCSSAVIRYLDEAIDTCKDDLEQKLWIYDSISDALISPQGLRSLMKWRKVALIGKLATLWLNWSLFESYEMLSTLILSLEELLEQKATIPLSPEHVDAVFEEVLANKHRAEKRFVALTDQFPELVKTIQTKQATHVLMVAMKKQLEAEKHLGTLKTDEYESLVDTLNHRMVLLDYQNPEFKNQDINECLLLTPYFKNLEPKHKELLKSTQTTTKIAAGKVLYQTEDDVVGIYIVSEGLMEETTQEGYNNKRSPGSVLSWVNIVAADGKAQATAIALNDTRLLLIPKSTILKIVSENKEFEEQIYKSSLHFLIKAYPKNMPFKVTEADIVRIQNNSSLLSKDSEDPFELPHGGFLISGELRRDDKERADEVLLPSNMGILLPGGTARFVAQKPAKLLQFMRPMLEILKDEESRSLDAPLAAPQRMRDGEFTDSTVNLSFDPLTNKEKDVESLFDEAVSKRFAQLLRK